jgi:transposase
MARPSTKTPDEKLRIVLAVLKGELSAAEAGRRHGVSEQTISNWRRAFLDAGRAGLATNKDRRHNSREAALEAEIEDLKAALGEAHVQLRVWKRSADLLPPSRTSR